MPIDTGVFITGVGIMVALDIFVAGLAVYNTRNMATSKEIEKLAERVDDAEEQAQQSHMRLSRHQRDTHGQEPSYKVDWRDLQFGGD